MRDMFEFALVASETPNLLLLANDDVRRYHFNTGERVRLKDMAEDVGFTAMETVPVLTDSDQGKVHVWATKASPYEFTLLTSTMVPLLWIFDPYSSTDSLIVEDAVGLVNGLPDILDFDQVGALSMTYSAQTRSVLCTTILGPIFERDAVTRRFLRTYSTPEYENLPHHYGVDRGPNGDVYASAYGSSGAFLFHWHENGTFIAKYAIEQCDQPWHIRWLGKQFLFLFLFVMIYLGFYFLFL